MHGELHMMAQSLQVMYTRYTNDQMYTTSSCSLVVLQCCTYGKSYKINKPATTRNTGAGAAIYKNPNYSPQIGDACALFLYVPLSR